MRRKPWAVRPTDAMRAPERRAQVSRRRLFKLTSSSGSDLLWVADAAGDLSIRRRSTFPPRLHFPRLTGTVQKFDGYLPRVPDARVARGPRRDEKDDEGEGRALPQVAEGQTLRLGQDRPDQHFTEPRRGSTMPRWSRSWKKTASGGPRVCGDHSTIVEREYVTKTQGRFSPTMLGERVSTATGKEFRRHLRTSRLRRGSRKTRRNRGRQAAVARSRQGVWENSS